MLPATRTGVPRRPRLLPILLAAPLIAAARPSTNFDVRSFGARGDGRVLDTRAVQRAIDACSASGGGEVLFPAGTYLSGTLVLRSRVTLHLDAGAVILGSRNLADYSPAHLIYGKGLEDVSIEGDGAIDGQGDAFFDKDFNPRDRPAQMIEIDDSRGVRIENVTIRNSPRWTLHPKNCVDVKIRGISLLDNLRAVNTDGIDVDADRNVMISDCRIESGDDCIVLKTDDPRAGATENVAVTNCVLVSSACALKLGTGSFRDYRHCVFSNCVIRDSRTGIALLAEDGGAMEDIRFSNIVMTTRPKWGLGLEWPIVIDVEKRTPASAVTHIRDVAFSDITVESKGRILAEGMPGSPLENISFRNIQVRVTGYEAIAGAHKLRGGAHVTAKGMPDYGAVPAEFIFGRVKGLTLDGVTLLWPEGARAPERQALYGDRLEDVFVTGFRGGASTAGAPAFKVERSPGVRL